jgi:hypothetical protein
MKQQLFFTFLLSMLFFACEPVKQSVGFTKWSDDGSEYKFYLGTESSIDVVKAFDAAAQAKTYDDFHEIFADSATLTYQNGQKDTVEDFIELNLVRDSILDANNATLTWEPQYALSVDIDPTRGGEHVNMMYLGTYTEGEEKSQFNANLWFFVQDGKIISVNQYNQAIVNEDQNEE